MNRLGTLALLLPLAGCAICSSSDNAEQCRTKQRDHSNPRTEIHAPLPDSTWRVNAIWRVDTPWRPAAGH